MVGEYCQMRYWGALESHADATKADCHISLYEISRAPNHRAIHIRALCDKQVFSILVDSGSSNTFINSSVLGRIPHTAEPAKPLKVKVANGQVIMSNEEVLDIEWWTQGHTFCNSARVPHLGAYDMILGMDWLEQHSPMNCDWANKSIGFIHKGQHIVLQGITPSNTQQLSEISGEQLLKLHKGNDLWALVVMSPAPVTDSFQELYMSTGIPATVQEVILEFDNLF
jgi:hypothetical protein